mmetsp:Transcript_1957/g.4524  ORF Transcript_1957/g.4524 Transcript_1957/m.4524 type:complete len:204 (+) Transcript_1957:352-963(+)
MAGVELFLVPAGALPRVVLEKNFEIVPVRVVQLRHLPRPGHRAGRSVFARPFPEPVRPPHDFMRVRLAPMKLDSLRADRYLFHAHGCVRPCPPVPVRAHPLRRRPVPVHLGLQSRRVEVDVEPPGRRVGVVPNTPVDILAGVRSAGSVVVDVGVAVVPGVVQAPSGEVLVLRVGAIEFGVLVLRVVLFHLRPAATTSHPRSVT